jgi:hypothetical protein
VSQRLIPTGKRSGLQTRIAVKESVTLRVTQSLQFRHMTGHASRFIERPTYVHNHSEEAAAQRDARHDGQHDRQASIQAIIGSKVIPPVKPELFRKRKELGICDRSVGFAIIVAISAWPVFAAADALNQFLQRTAS